MFMSFDLLLKNGTAILPGQTCPADIAIKNGKIFDIGSFEDSQAQSVIDCKGLHILPGIIDTQVHFREPGATHKEDLQHGMMAAAMGGVTSIFEMPNTSPLTTTPEAIQDKINRAKQHAYTNYAFYLGGTAANAKNLKEWENLPGVCGIKIFMGASTGDLLSSTDQEIEAVLSSGRRIVAVHAEDEEIMNKNKDRILKQSDEVALHPVWRSVDSCLSATKRVIGIARKHGRRVHILHITTREEMEFLKDHRDIASVEVLANHLTLHAPDCYNTLGAKAQQNPPIREKEHQEALWKAVKNGLVDIIGSDHAPHTEEEKSMPYPKSPSGTPGVQTLVPVMLNHVHNEKLTLERLVDLLCYGPQRIHQIASKGRIVCGYDADFTIVDLQAEKEIKDQDQLSKSGWTPFAGLKTRGWPVMTIVNGTVVMREDSLVAKAGSTIKFRETLNANA
jgi:dihydroorotase